MSKIYAIPNGRGRGAKNWAKEISSIARNAQSGRDWDGNWLTCRSDAELDDGAMVVVGDKDGEGAVVYIAIPDGSYSDGPWMFKACDDASKKWGSAMSIESRKWMAMDTGERIRAAKIERAEELEAHIKNCSDAADDDAKARLWAEKFGNRTEDEVRGRIAMLRGIDTSTSPGDVQQPAIDIGNEYARWTESLMVRGVSLQQINDAVRALLA